MSLASTLSYEDVRQVAAPRAGTADDMIEQLTPAEREALARMLHAGMGDVRMTRACRRVITTACVVVVLGATPAWAQEPPPTSRRTPAHQRAAAGGAGTAGSPPICRRPGR